MRPLPALILSLLFGSLPHFSRAQADTLALQLQYTPVEEGLMFCIDVTAEGVTDLDSLQFSFSWPSGRLRFQGVEGVAIMPVVPSEFIPVEEPFEPKNISSALWRAEAGQSVTLPDGSVLFRLCFEAVRYTDGDEKVRFLQTPSPIRAFQPDGAEIPVKTEDASLVIFPRQDIVLSITDTVAYTDSVACVQVQVQKPADDLLSMQFGLAWDPSFLQFQSFSPVDLPNFGPNNAGLSHVDQGQLLAIWFDQDFRGETFEEGRALFELCFRTPAEAGITEVAFSDELVSFEFTNVREEFLFMEGSPGMIAASPEPYVWPGDADQNGITDNQDLLQLGLGYAAAGPVRLNPSLTWQKQLAADWNGATPVSGVNFKHLDTDGNGVVDLSDTLAIAQNWGAATSENGIRTVQPRGSSLPLYVETQATTTDAQERFPIILGDDAQTAEPVYGLAFTIRYDPTVIEASSVRVDVEESWLRTAGSELMTIQRNFPEESRIAVAVSRIDRNNVSGSGPIGHIRFRLLSSTSTGGDYEMDFVVENVRLIDASETEKAVSPATTQALVSGTTARNAPYLAGQIRLFPNPARTYVRIDAPRLSLESILLTSMDGKVIRRYEPAELLPLPSLPAGNYLLRIVSREGVAVKEIIVAE